MSEKPIVSDAGYKKWLSDLKLRIRSVQLKAALSVNSGLLQFYWELGADIVAKQVETKWGEGLFLQLSADLITEFPDMKGFSVSNLRYIRQWYLFYSDAAAIHQQAVGESGQELLAQITMIPWGHNIAIMSKCKQLDEALYYVSQTVQNNWSRAVLVHQIESGVYRREGKGISNFACTLPQPQSDLVIRADGTVGLCKQDLDRAWFAGDLTTETLAAVWERLGEAFTRHALGGVGVPGVRGV